MSQGAFNRSRYTRSNTGADIHPIRIQPETLTLTFGGTANAAPTGAFTSDISASVSKGRRGIGLKARTVTFVFTGTPPTGYKADSPITLPILQPALWAGLSRGTTGTYTVGGTAQAIEVLYKTEEKAG